MNIIMSVYNIFTIDIFQPSTKPTEPSPLFGISHTGDRDMSYEEDACYPHYLLSNRYLSFGSV